MWHPPAAVCFAWSASSGPPWVHMTWIASCHATHLQNFHHVVWQNHLEKGSVTRINLSDSRWSKNTINTHKYNTIYWSSSRSYCNLGSCISYIEEVWRKNYTPKDTSESAKAISLNGQDILFALKENVIHRCSKPESPSTESNRHQFRLPTDNPLSASPARGSSSSPAHRRQQEQTLSDYAQQDLSKVTKRSPLDMQRF
jgi:hypothetical protein